jgi:hypothetical protein
MEFSVCFQADNHGRLLVEWTVITAIIKIYAQSYTPPAIVILPYEQLKFNKRI